MILCLCSIDKNVLGRVDQIAGGVLGMIKIIFMASVVIWILNSIKMLPDKRWANESWLYPKVAAFAPKITNLLAGVIPAFKGIF